MVTQTLSPPPYTCIFDSYLFDKMHTINEAEINLTTILFVRISLWVVIAKSLWLRRTKEKSSSENLISP